MTAQDHSLRKLGNLIIDMDGVLYRGNQAIPGTPEFLAFLRAQHIGFVMATNNSTRTPQQYVEKLAKMGVTISEHEVITSAQATASFLASTVPAGTPMFVVGQDGLREALCSAGFNLVEADAQYVVVGMDFSVQFERLAKATLLIRGGAEFIGTNPDRTFPSERGIIPGAGSLLAFLETATDIKPTVIGKPETAMLDLARERMAAAPETTAVLGDRLETDILAGQRAGLATILVLSGITDRSMLAGAEIQPDLVFEDVADLHAAWRSALHG